MNKNHRCRKEDIDWDPDIGDRAIGRIGLEWHGTCRRCGRRVYEVYSQLGFLLDAASNEELSAD